MITHTLKTLSICLILVSCQPKFQFQPDRFKSVLPIQKKITYPDTIDIQKLINDIDHINGSLHGIVAWKIIEDNRPLHVESIIVVIKKNDDTWFFTHLYRHKKRRNIWCTSSVMDADQTPYITLQKKPTQSQLITYLDDTWWWHETNDKNWMVHDIGFNTDLWYSLTGELPPNPLRTK